MKLHLLLAALLGLATLPIAFSTAHMGVAIGCQNAKSAIKTSDDAST